MRRRRWFKPRRSWIPRVRTRPHGVPVGLFRRRRPWRGWRLVGVAVLVAGGWWGLSWWRDGYADCVMPSRPGLVDAATDRRSVGAAERRVVASSVLPWGASVAVTTRVWGTHSVERWVVTDRRFEKCSLAQARPVGDFFYDFNLRPGESDPTFRWFGQDEPVSAETSARWEEMFGGVTEFEIDGVDRTLAWLRVYPELLFLVPVGGLLVWSRRQTRFQG